MEIEANTREAVVANGQSTERKNQGKEEVSRKTWTNQKNPREPAILRGAREGGNYGGGSKSRRPGSTALEGHPEYVGSHQLEPTQTTHRWYRFPERSFPSC